MFNNEENAITYIVVMNHEEQYSIWPEEKALPPGWKNTGKAGSKEDCLKYIETVWVDMRPLSLRTKMQAEKSGDPVIR